MTQPIPNIIARKDTVAKPSSKTKASDPSIILFDDEAYPSVVLEKLLFEDISGQELLSIARTTDLSGAFVSNRIISNSADIAIKYSPENIIYIPDSLPSFFRDFSIDLFSKIPGEQVSINPDTQTSSDSPNAYFDYKQGGLVIEFSRLNPDEQVEVEILSSADSFNDTIYSG